MCGSAMTRPARSPGVADKASPTDYFGFAPGGSTSAPYRYRFSSSPGQLARLVTPGVRPTRFNVFSHWNCSNYWINIQISLQSTFELALFVVECQFKRKKKPLKVAPKSGFGKPHCFRRGMPS